MGYKLLYDGECSFCHNLAMKLVKLDRHKKLTIDSLQSHYALDESIPLSHLKKDVHLIGPSGIHVGAAAIEKVLQILPEAAPLKGKLMKKLTEKVSNPLYRFLQGRRKSSSCSSCGH